MVKPLQGLESNPSRKPTDFRNAFKKTVFFAQEERPMSTKYRTEKKILFSELLDGRLERLGVREEARSAADVMRCLTDGQNCLWVRRRDNGTLGVMTRTDDNKVDKILSAIEQSFETSIFTEFSSLYWGYDTNEELAHAM